MAKSAWDIQADFVFYLNRHLYSQTDRIIRNKLQVE